MEKEELTELVESLAKLCLTAHAVIAAQAAKIDALIACTTHYRPHEVPSMRDLLLQAVEHGQSTIEPEQRPTYQSQIAQTMAMIDRLSGS